MSHKPCGGRIKALVVAGLAAVLATAPGLALAWGGCGCGGYGGYYGYHGYGYGWRHYGYGYGDGYGYGLGYGYAPAYGYGYGGYGYPGYAYSADAYAPALAYGLAGPHTTTSCTPYGCAQVQCGLYGGDCQQVGPWYWRH